jgi:hypothetical protein
MTEISKKNLLEGIKLQCEEAKKLEIINQIKKLEVLIECSECFDDNLSILGEIESKENLNNINTQSNIYQSFEMTSA